MLKTLLVNVTDLIASLNIAWKGMLAIAIVIALIVGVTAAMTAIEKRRTKLKKKEKEEK